MAAVLLPGVAAAAPNAPASGNKNSWGQFVSSRSELLEELAGPIENCFARHDPFLPGYTSPMFNGCIDWHSSVHAAYSLYMIYGKTGDVRYLQAVEAKVKDELVPAELEYVQTANFRGNSFLFYENPYGLSWFLALAMEREKVTGNHGLRPLADFFAQRIREYIDAFTAEEMPEQILVPAHYNLSWAMIHLQMWAKYTGDEQLMSFMQQKAMPALLNPALDTGCPAQADTGQEFREFFPPCLMRIAAVAQIWDVPHAELRSWVGQRVPSDFWVERVTDPNDRSGHKFGINFSRAYTLWHIWKATNNVRHRQNYTDLISYHVSRPELWDIEAGYNVSHFVPQFGVRAIAQGFDKGGA